MKASDLEHQIDQARKSIQLIKKNQPYMLVQYGELCRAEDELKAAINKYILKLNAWEELGT